LSFRNTFPILALSLLSLVGCGGSDQVSVGAAPQNRAFLTEAGVLQSLEADSLKTYVQRGGAKYPVALVLDQNFFLVTTSLLSTGFVWSSSNPSVVSIDPNTGLFRGLAIGQATITVNYNGLVDSGLVTVVDAGGRGGPVRGQVKVTVLTSVNDGALAGAVVDIGGRVAVTDLNGEAVITDPAMTGPQDVHVFASGFATFSIYQIDNDDLVLPLTRLFPTTGIVTGSALGLASDNFSIVSAEGTISTPLRGNQYTIPNFSAVDLNGAPRPVPPLPMGSRFYGVSVFSIACQDLIRSQPTQFQGLKGIGPVDVRFPLVQTFDLTTRPVFVGTGATIRLPRNPTDPDFTPSDFTSDDLQELQGYAFFGGDGEVQTGLDANRYCQLHFNSNFQTRAPALDSVHMPGALYYSVQVNTDLSPRVVQELGKGFSLARKSTDSNGRPFTQYPSDVTLDLMAVPKQLFPADTISGSVGVTPELRWENTTGRDIAFYQVRLSDGGPFSSVRGNYFWQLIFPGTPAGAVSSWTLPAAPTEAPADSGVVIPGSLVNWTVIGFDLTGGSYDLQRGGFLNGFSNTPKHIFRP
jgi:hypothetical protein